MIETLQEWNERMEACGCCQMQEIGPPIMGIKRVSSSLIPNSNARDVYDSNQKISKYKMESFTASSFDLLYDGGGIERGYQEGSVDNTAKSGSYQTWSLSASPQTPCAAVSINPSLELYVYGGGSYVYRYRDGSGDGSDEDLSYAPEPNGVWRETGTIKTYDNNVLISTTNVNATGSGACMRVTAYTNGFTCNSGTVTVTREGVETYDEFVNAAPGRLRGRMDLAPDSCYVAATTGNTIAKLTLTENIGKTFGSTSPLISGTATKIRWFFPTSAIPDPDLFEFQYCKITFDVVFFPTGTNSETVTIAQDVTVELTSPGAAVTETVPSKGTQTGWWIGDWYLIPVPKGYGESRVVNLRYTYKNGASTYFGTLPSVSGEAETPEPAALNFDETNRSALAPLL